MSPRIAGPRPGARLAGGAIETERIAGGAIETEQIAGGAIETKRITAPRRARSVALWLGRPVGDRAPDGASDSVDWAGGAAPSRPGTNVAPADWSEPVRMAAGDRGCGWPSRPRLSKPFMGADDMKHWLRGLLGDRGERRAASFLGQRGFKILARRVSSRFGEIDLVALDGRTVVFVEVRTRRTLEAGHPAESVTPAKQARLTRAALAFLKQNNLLEHSSRFDVVAVVWPAGAHEPRIEHYKNAFEPADRGQFFA